MSLCSRNSEKSQKLKYSGYRIRMPPKHPPLEVLWAHPCGWRWPGADLEHDRTFRYLIRPGDASGSLSTSCWRASLKTGMSRPPCSTCCHHDGQREKLHQKARRSSFATSLSLGALCSRQYHGGHSFIPHRSVLFAEFTSHFKRD